MPACWTVRAESPVTHMTRGVSLPRRAGGSAQSARRGRVRARCGKTGRQRAGRASSSWIWSRRVASSGTWRRRAIGHAGSGEPDGLSAGAQRPSGSRRRDRFKRSAPMRNTPARSRQAARSHAGTSAVSRFAMKIRTGASSHARAAGLEDALGRHTTCSTCPTRCSSDGSRQSASAPGSGARARFGRPAASCAGVMVGGSERRRRKVFDSSR